MEAFAAIGGGAFVLASLVVGLRLIRLGMQTERLPELAMGIRLTLFRSLQKSPPTTRMVEPRRCGFGEQHVGVRAQQPALLRHIRI